MGPQPRVYITRQIPQKGLDILLEKCHVSFWDSSDPAPRGELLQNVSGVDVLLCMPNDTIDKEILNMAGNQLKVVATMSEDTHNIDLAECERRLIKVVKLPTVSTETIRDLTVVVLATATVDWMDEENGNLNRMLQRKNVSASIKGDKSYCVELSNRTLGLYGFGTVGLSVGQTFKDFGIANILYHDVSPVVSAGELDAKYVTFDELLEGSDIICICSSNVLNQETKPPMFTKTSFSKMREGAILIDSAKGRFIDFFDLYIALKAGQIRAAGLDLREYDVIPNRHPLASLQNCYFLPFRESYKWDGRRNLSGVLAKDIIVALESS